MEQCFRVAFWMCLLVGYLQAKPVDSQKAEPFIFDEEDLSFDLISDASCVNNTTFSSPIQVQGNCLSGALELFMKELIYARNNCDQKEYISQTLEAFKRASVQETSCNFTITIHREFASFVNATKAFVQLFNTYQLSLGQ